MGYKLPAKERGDTTIPEGYEQCRLCTKGKIVVASVQNAVIGKSNNQNPQMKAWACVDKGPLAGKCILFVRDLRPDHIWSLKYAIRTTKTDKGIPENTEYEFKDDNDILKRVGKMAGPALTEQANLGTASVSMLKHFLNPEDVDKHPEAELIIEDQVISFDDDDNDEIE